ncbi:uncharacterized protein OCT59_027846 [Rhizophagus irregularis]|uniref:uncharacterized protein n=1 Tax=Rhizophagus irregularis TaxID=588596 RepID=UPI000CAD2A7C|nr:hypothetical protein OCT59_027846 [Rhizophagus irregularis]GBC15579.1 hypothetical protein RIR_jg13891.t1 [Rhizophagus irregularis DAOM 181602=DAOM 197198]
MLPNVVLETTDLAGNNKFNLHLNIKSFDLSRNNLISIELMSSPLFVIIDQLMKNDTGLSHNLKPKLRKI